MPSKTAIKPNSKSNPPSQSSGIWGFLFLLVGAFWTIEAFATRSIYDPWFLNLIAGILMIVLGFWTGGQFIATKASTLLIFVGILTLFHGVTDIIRAFRIKHLGQQVSPPPRVKHAQSGQG